MKLIITPLLVETHHKFDNVDFNLDSIYYDDFGTMINLIDLNFMYQKITFYNSIVLIV